jgi:CelD/BcsL family acetyltransferase involved in cellulose biosynthesis
MSVGGDSTDLPMRGHLTLEPVSDLAAARADWSRLAERAGNVFGTWEWADTWYRHLGAGAELAIALSRGQDGEAAAILPLCVARKRPVRVVRFLGAGPSDELGPLCAPADRPATATALRRHVAETLGDSGIFLGERLWGEHRLGAQLGATTVRATASPVLPISGRSFDDFLASRSRNFRNQVGRRERTVARNHRLEYRLTQDESRLEEDMRTLIRLHHAHWRHGESRAFSARRASFHLEFARQALGKGWLRLWTMELDGLPAAAWYGLRYGGIEFYYQAGRDPAFDKLHVGFVLLCHTIRCAFEDGMREYRFGQGGEPYKHRFAESDPGLDTVAITSGARGRLALAAIRSALRLPGRVRSLAWRLGGPT